MTACPKCLSGPAETAEAPKYCWQCGWPLEQPCPYSELGCPALYPVTGKGDRPGSCGACHRPIAYSDFGRMTRYGADGELDRPLIDWSGPSGPGNRGSADLGEGPIKDLRANEYGVFEAPDLLIASARTAGQVLVLTSLHLRVLQRDGQLFSFPLGSKPRRMLAAVWYAWIETAEGIVAVNILTNETWKNPASGGRLLLAQTDGSALLGDREELRLLSRDEVVWTQTLAAPPVAAVRLAKGTVVILDDGAVYEVTNGGMNKIDGPNGKCRHAFSCGERIYLVLSDAHRIVEIDPGASPARIKDMPYPNDPLPVAFCRSAGPLIVTSSDGASSGLQYQSWDSDETSHVPVAAGTQIRSKLGLDARSGGKPDRALVTIEARATWTLRASAGSERRSLLEHPLGPGVLSGHLLGTERGFVLVHQIPGKIVVTEFVATR